jgi:hypothetical protein
VLLGVVQPRERTPLRERETIQVEEDCRSDERTGERSATGLVRAGDEAALEAAIEGEELPPPRLATALRACRSGRAASR